MRGCVSLKFVPHTGRTITGHMLTLRINFFIAGIHIMSKGPREQTRPSDVIANAKVMKIAAGEIEEDTKEAKPKNAAAAEVGRKGGQARAQKLGEL